MKEKYEYGKLTLTKIYQAFVITTLTLVVLIYFDNLLKPLIIALFS